MSAAKLILGSIDLTVCVGVVVLLLLMLLAPCQVQGAVLQLTWTNPIAYTSNMLLRSVNGSLTTIAILPLTNSFQDKGLSNSTPYIYTVRGSTGSVWSLNSNIATGTTEAAGVVITNTITVIVTNLVTLLQVDGFTRSVLTSGTFRLGWRFVDTLSNGTTWLMLGSTNYVTPTKSRLFVQGVAF
jgi:hypothetical protein